MHRELRAGILSWYFSQGLLCPYPTTTEGGRAHTELGGKGFVGLISTLQPSKRHEGGILVALMEKASNPQSQLTPVARNPSFSWFLLWFHLRLLKATSFLSIKLLAVEDCLPSSHVFLPQNTQITMLNGF